MTIGQKETLNNNRRKFWKNFDYVRSKYLFRQKNLCSLIYLCGFYKKISKYKQMKRYKKYILPILAIIIVLGSSCRKIISVDLNPKDKKIVLNSIMNKNSVEARISLSFGLNDRTQDVVYLKTAKVSLFEGETQIGHLDNGSDSLPGYYVLSNLNLKYETNYSLKVEDASYGIISAMTQIPKPVQIDTITKSGQTISEFDGSKSETYLFSVKIEDSPTTANYYGIVDSVTFEYHDYNYDTNKDTIYITKNSIYVDSKDPANEAEWNNILFFRDDLFDGRTYSFKVNIDKYSFYSDTTENEFYLLSFSKEYYLYLRTMSAQANQDNFSLILGATPVQVYSNVEGGFGFFGAYSLTSKNIQVIGNNQYPLE